MPVGRAHRHLSNVRETAKTAPKVEAVPTLDADSMKLVQDILSDSVTTLSLSTPAAPVAPVTPAVTKVTKRKTTPLGKQVGLVVPQARCRSFIIDNLDRDESKLTQINTLREQKRPLLDTKKLLSKLLKTTTLSDTERLAHAAKLVDVKAELKTFDLQIAKLKSDFTRVGDDVAVVASYVTNQIIHQMLDTTFAFACDEDIHQVDVDTLYEADLSKCITYPLFATSSVYSDWDEEEEKALRAQRKEENKKQAAQAEERRKLVSALLLQGKEMKEIEETLAEEDDDEDDTRTFMAYVKKNIANLRFRVNRYANLRVTSRFREHVDDIVSETYAHLTRICEATATLFKTRTIDARYMLHAIEVEFIHCRVDEAAYASFLSQIREVCKDYSSRKKEQAQQRLDQLPEEKRAELKAKKLELKGLHEKKKQAKLESMKPEERAQALERAKLRAQRAQERVAALGAYKPT